MKILISTGKNPENYIKALESFGVEVVGGYLPKPDFSVDGIILCGGNDIAPSIYGKANEGSVEIDVLRDNAELEILKTLKDKPILGICRGMQMINAYFGGTLVQDLVNKNEHVGNGDVYHGVKAENGIFKKLFGESFTVNSAHHQAIDKLAKGFSATLLSTDGVIEGIEHESLPVFAVQWHPERTMLGYKKEGVIDGSKIFEEFLKLCK